jgi:hypothetical protein
MKKSQGQRILEVLESAKGGWVPAVYFIREMWLTQASARITELKHKGHNIQSTDDVGEPRDSNNFVSYRIPVEAPTSPVVRFNNPSPTSKQLKMTL